METGTVKVLHQWKQVLYSWKQVH